MSALIPAGVHVLLKILFIDAGPTRSAWVVVEVRSDGTIVPVQGGWRSMRDAAWLGAQMDAIWESGGVVALEYIDGGLYDRKRWQNLMETGRVEGDIRTVGRAQGADHVLLPFDEMPARRKTHPRTLFCVPASSWRRYLLGRPNARNVEIAVVVLWISGKVVEVRGGGTARVLDLPGMDYDSKEHVLDATGGAIVCASVFLGARLTIPAEVRAEQEQARAKAGQRKAIERTLGKLGATSANHADGSPVVLKASRGVKAGRRAGAANTRAAKRMART